MSDWSVSVWAPSARSVELELEGRRQPLTRGQRGYWALPGSGLPPGTRYRIALDGGEALPDPRSHWQPEGVHGPSEVVNHAAFAWADAEFSPPPLEAAVIYELHVGTFSPEGTYEGCRARLDHLVELGVTHIELMPLAEFPGRRGWGYDGVQLFAPHHAYGTPDDLRRLVDACHARGLSVLLDVVYNHLGPDGNHLEKFGPYFTAQYATPWGKAVNFDAAGSDEVRRFFCDNALHWLEHYHFDGLRIDAVHAILDRSAEPFLAQLSAEVRELGARLGRPKILIAESDLNDPRLLWSAEQGGSGMDAQWSDDFHHALHVLSSGERDGYYSDFEGLDDLERALREGFVYAGRHSPHRDRRHGRSLGELPLNRLLGYVQNHDQVGNRAEGDRLGAKVPVRRLEVCAALVLLGPFVPMLFQGEEWNASSPFCYFTDHQDAELGQAVREGRRREFASMGWDPARIPDPQALATFEASKLPWDELARPEQRRLFDWYRTLIQLRRTRPELSGAQRPVVIREGECLRLERGAVQLACNFGAGSARLACPPSARLLLGSEGVEVGGQRLSLPPWGVAVLENRG